MSHRQSGKMQGERYLGNERHQQVHDLDQERPECHIDQIIESQHERPFESLDDAHYAGFRDCGHCIGSGEGQQP